MGELRFRHFFGTAEFNDADLELRVEGRPIRVQRKPLELLALLLEHGGAVVRHDLLRQQLWGGAPTVENVVANAVAKLRRALGPANAELIITLPRVGYRMAVVPQRVSLEDAGGPRPAWGKGATVPHRPDLHLGSPLVVGHDIETWMARDASAGEERIVKLATGAAGLETLRREAEISDALCGSGAAPGPVPRVVRRCFDTPPFVLELAGGGQPLDTWARESDRLRGLGVPLRLAIVRRLCSTVAALHAAGGVHAELRPSHWLLHQDVGDRGWHAVLIHLGQMVRPASTERDAAPAWYTAPEVLAGGAATTASDVYALGGLAYRLMAGDLARPMASGWERDIEDPLLRADIARATDVEPSLRFADARALVDALDRLPQRRALAARDQAARLRATIQTAFSSLNDLDAAVAAGRRAVEAAIALADARSPLALVARVQLAADLARSGQYEEAAALLDAAEADMTDHRQVGAADRARLWWARSDLHAYCLRLPESLAAAELAVDFLSQSHDTEPTLADAIRTRRGIARRMLGDYVGSEHDFRTLVAVQAARDGDSAESTQRTRVALARCLMFLQRNDEALALAQFASEGLAIVSGVENLATQQAMDAIASIQFKVQRYAQAALTWQGVVEVLHRITPRPTDFAVAAQANVALAQLYAGNQQRAEASGAQALELARQLFADTAPRVQSIRYHLAACRLDLERIDGVETLLDGLSAAALKQAIQANDWEARLAYQRGRLALLQGHRAKAIAWLEEARLALARHEANGLVTAALAQRWLRRAACAGG